LDKIKKLDLVKLKNDKSYKNFGLAKDAHGIVIEIKYDNADILFFNPQNVGDYAIVNVKLLDLELEKEKIPVEFEKELLSKLDDIIEKAKKEIQPIKIKEYDMVELIVEEDRYAKFGIHKGDRGCVMDNNAIQNYIEVDFSGIDKYGEFYGDCISVKIDDLKVIK